MRWAFVGIVDDPDARATIRQLVEAEDEDALELNGQVIGVEDMLPLSDPDRGRLRYLCIGCGGAVQRARARGWWRVHHSRPHTCSFLGDG